MYTSGHSNEIDRDNYFNNFDNISNKKGFENDLDYFTARTKYL